MQSSIHVTDDSKAWGKPRSINQRDGRTLSKYRLPRWVLQESTPAAEASKLRVYSVLALTSCRSDNTLDAMLLSLWAKDSTTIV